MIKPSASPDNRTDTIGGAMSVGEFCRWSCISRTKLYSEVKAGRLELRKVGTKSVILRSDAEAWLRNLPTASAS